MATLTPYEGSGYYTTTGESTRQAVNLWIGTDAAFDAVIDFDLVTRNPSHPTQLLPQYDGGDHLHRTMRAIKPWPMQSISVCSLKSCGCFK